MFKNVSFAINLTCVFEGRFQNIVKKLFRYNSETYLNYLNYNDSLNLLVISAQLGPHLGEN